MRALVLPIAIAVGLAMPAIAIQEPQATPSPSTVFPTAVEIVNVDVVVLDASGNPIEGLTQADFVVREDGKPQAISSFEAAVLAESRPEPRPGRQRIATNATTPQRGDRTFIVVFDDANLSATATARAQKAITDFLAQGPRDGDSVMVVPTSGGAWWTGQVPEDRDELVAFVGRLEGSWRPDNTAARIWDYEAAAIANDRDRQLLAQVARRYYENNLIPETYPGAFGDDRDLQRELDVSPGIALIRAKAREVYSQSTARLRTTLTTLSRVSSSLADLRGRKTLFLVSEGFIMDPVQTEFRELLRAARNSNTAVYFVDVRGTVGALGQAGMVGGNAEFGRAVEEQEGTQGLAFATREVEGARSIALDTGGAVLGGTELANAMVKVGRESRSYYLLGYSSTNQKRDGKFRKIEVSVSRPDVEVRARRGYYAPSKDESRPPSEDKLDPAVRAALDSPHATTGIPLRLTSYVLGRQEGGKVQTLLVAEADIGPLRLQPRDGSYSATFESYLVVHGHTNGRLERQEALVELALPQEAYAQAARSGVPIRRELALEPGLYQARLLLRDRATGLAGSVRHEFDVPGPGVLRLSTPMLTDSLRAAENGQPRPVPVAHRVFRAGSRLACAFEIYGAAPDAALGGPRVSVAYRLLGPGGADVASSPARALKPGPLGELSYGMMITLPSAARGPHDLVFSVTDEVSTRTLEAVESFEVSSE